MSAWATELMSFLAAATRTQASVNVIASRVAVDVAVAVAVAAAAAVASWQWANICNTTLLTLCTRERFVEAKYVYISVYTYMHTYICILRLNECYFSWKEIEIEKKWGRTA